jgi:DNA polymerase-3 subunit delta
LLYILAGQDDFTITETLRKIKGGIGQDSLLEANTSQFEAEGLSAGRLQAECATVPFMTEKRLVVVNNLLWRFHPKDRAPAAAATPKKTTGKKAEEVYQAFAAVLNQLPRTTSLVLVDTQIKDRDLKKFKDLNPLFRAIEAGATIQLTPLRTGMELNMWIQVKTKDMGGSISTPAVNALARLIGGNLWLMSGEINKLVLYARDRRIEEKDVRSLVSSAQESTIFNLIDAVFEGKVDLAVSILQRLLQLGESPAQILFMLARQMQLIVRLKDMKEGGGYTKLEMQQKLGLMLEFAWLKTAAQAERFTATRIREIYRRLLEADLSIKTGKYDGETAVTMLITEITAEAKINS